jgi:hypothetical protein
MPLAKPCRSVRPWPPLVEQLQALDASERELRDRRGGRLAPGRLPATCGAGNRRGAPGPGEEGYAWKPRRAACARSSSCRPARARGGGARRRSRIGPRVAGQAARALAPLERTDPTTQPWRELLDAAYANLSELARMAREYAETAGGRSGPPGRAGCPARSALQAPAEIRGIAPGGSGDPPCRRESWTSSTPPISICAPWPPGGPRCIRRWSRRRRP